MSEWHPIERALAVVQKARTGEWQWPMNYRCKYIGLRVDMRTGSCVLTDRDGNPITFEELENQSCGS